MNTQTQLVGARSQTVVDEQPQSSGSERTSAKEVRVADQIVRTLADLGVKTIFGVPGGAISAIYDALLDEPRITVVNTRHESSAVFAAAAYARQSKTVGVVLTTSGPGVTNTITGIASCYCDGLPVVLIGGEVPRKNYGKGALQEGSPYSLNLVAMFKHITKWSTEVITGETAIAHIRKSFSIASSGRKGPIFLSLPLDVQTENASVPRLSLNVESRFALDEASLNAAVQALLTARRPMILAGSGCRWGEGPRELRRVAESYRIPVATTPKGKGVFSETHPLSLGVFGYGGHPSAIEYLESNVDVLLAIGTSFGDVATNSWSEALKPTRCSIHLEIEPSQIGKNYQADIALIGDASQVLSEIANLAPPAPPLREVTSKRFYSAPEMAEEEGPIKPLRALWELQQLMPKSTVYLCDIGDHLLWAVHYLTIDRPDSFLVFSGLAAMGSSLGAALGAKLAHPDRPVVTVCGDGTFSMDALDVADAARCQRRVIYFVMNDHRYGMVEQGHSKIYGRTPEFPIMLSVADVGRALGADVRSVKQPGELIEMGSRFLLEGNRPLVLDVQISPAEKLPAQPRFDSLRQSSQPSVS